MITCKNCPNCDVITDDEYCKRLKCTGTKRSKTITWSMCIKDGNVYSYFANYLENHLRPNWCPRVKEELKNDEVRTGLYLQDNSELDECD